MAIPEKLARETMRLLPQLSGESQAKGVRILEDYKAQQERLRQPLFPEQDRETAKETMRLRTAFQDRERHGLNASEYAELEESVKHTMEPTAAKFRAINSQFLGKTFGKNPGKLNGSYEAYRDAYAKQRWGVDKLSDEAFFNRVADDFDREDETIQKATQAAITDAIEGKQDWIRAFNGAGMDESKMRSLPEASAWRKQFQAAYERTVTETAAFAPEVKSFAEALQRSMTGEAKDGDETAIATFRDRLIDAPHDEREAMLRALTIYGAKIGESVDKTGEQSGRAAAFKGTKEWFQQAGESAARILSGMSSDTQMVEALLSNLQESPKVPVSMGVIDSEESGFSYVESELRNAIQKESSASEASYFNRETREMREPTPEELKWIEAGFERQQRAINAARQITSIAQSTDPIKSVTAQTVGSSGALMLVSAIPVVGPLSAAQGYSNLEYDNLRMEFPDLPIGKARSIALVSGAVQGALDRLSVDRFIFRALPSVSTLLTKGMTNTLAKRAAGAAVSGYVFENVIEGAQDLATPVAQEIFSALSNDVPSVDWDSEWKKWAATRGDVAIGMLPLTLLGMGVATVRDVSNARGILSSYDTLRASGLSEDVAADVVGKASSGDVKGAHEALKAAWPTRKPASQEAFDKADADMQARMDAFTRLSQAGALPGIRRTQDGWALTFQDGSGVEYGTYTEADQSRWDYAGTQALAVAEETRSVIRQIEANLETGREISYEFSPERMDAQLAQEQGLADSAALQERMDVGERLGANVSKEFQESADAVRVASLDTETNQQAAQILGSNQSQWVNGIQKTTIRLYQGASPLTVVEEKLESDVSRMLKDGKAEWLVGLLRDYERASGDVLLSDTVESDLLSGDTAKQRAAVTSIRESYSHLGTSYFVGKSKRGESALSSSKFRKLAADLMRTRIGGILTAYGRFFRSVFRRAATLRKLSRDGRLNPELERQLALSLGLSDQQQEQEAQLAEAERLAIELQDSLQYTPPDDAPFSMLTPRTALVEKGEGYQKTALPDGSILEGPAGFSIIAYHGTPHKVDKFSLDKIGTGEGAQAYGWGLYFAASRDVAEQYRINLAYDPDKMKINGRQINDEYSRIEKQANSGTAKDWLYQVMDGLERLMTHESPEQVIEYGKESDWDNRSIDYFRNAKFETFGSLYTVELLADDPDFLDWDKPLSDQSEKVKRALAKFNGDYSPNSDEYDANETGQMVYMRAWENAIRTGEAKPAKTKQATLSLRLNKLGIKGIRYLDGNSRDGGSGTYNYVIFDEDLVKIIAENGTPVSDLSGERGFSAITPAQDRAYLDAVKAGDMETAQRMVDEAAKAAGATMYYRAGDSSEIGVKPWASFSPEEKTAREYLDNPGFGGETLRKVFVSPGAVLRADVRSRSGMQQIADAIGWGDQEWITDGWQYPWEESRKVRDAIEAAGFDSVEYKDDFPAGATTIVFTENLDPSQIKSADPVTYDANGNVIPLSQRFNPERDEISFSALPRTIASDPAEFERRLVEMFDPFQRSPELRTQIMQLAQRNGSEAIRKWQPIAAIASRTKADVEAERRAMRDRLIDEGISGLDPSVFERLSIPEELLNAKDYPVFERLLRRKSYTISKGPNKGKTRSYWAGRLESPSAYKERTGKPMPPEYDGMGDIPSWIFGGTLRPEEARDELGLETTNDLWDEIHKALNSAALRTEERAAAQAEVDAIEQGAKEQANAWAEKELARVGSIKDQRENLTGAIRTLNAMISALPPEIRGKVGGFVTLSQKVTPAAMLKELMDRAEKMDRELEAFLRKDFDERVKKLFDRAKPAKDKAGKKRVGKAGADIHSLFDLMREAWKKWDGNETEQQATGLESKIGTGDLTGEREDFNQLAANMVRLFGDWRNADAARRSAAYEAANDLWSKGFNEWQKIKAAEREQRTAIREALIKATGKKGSAAERDRSLIKATKSRGFLKDMMLSLLPFEGVARYAFGDGSKEAIALADMERKASNQYSDRMFSVADTVDAFFAELAGGRKIDGERLRWQLSQKDVAIGDRIMSQMEMVQASLMWAQEDGKRHMIGHLDEAGQPDGAWHYGEAFMAEVDSKLSSEARELLSFLQEQYGSEYDQINPLYSELNGVNLPRNLNYAPLTVVPLQSSGGMVADPVTGQMGSARSTTPGSLLTRGTSIAEPDFRDALQTFLGHKKQMEHWLAYAKFNREARAILGNRDVANAVEGKASKEAAAILRGWVDLFETGGNRDAESLLAFSRGISKMTSRAAQMGIVGRVGTLMLQSSQLAAASAEMPTGAYLYRFGRLMAGRLSWKEALNSDYIQRRINQMPPIVQQGMEGLKAGKPNELKAAVQRMGSWISGMDGLFTAGTFAIVYDYHLTQLTKAGVPFADAQQQALQTAERVTDRVAQPTRIGGRSLYENRATGPLVRLVWAFASESRKNLGLLIGGAMRGNKRDAARAFGFIIANGIVSTIIRAAWRDAKDDDDEELWDEKNWNPGRLALLSFTDILSGIPAIGDAIQASIFSASGYYSSENNLFSALPRAAVALTRLDELASGELTSEEAVRDIEAILMGAGLFNDEIAAFASIAHLLRDGFQISTSGD